MLYSVSRMTPPPYSRHSEENPGSASQTLLSGTLNCKGVKRRFKDCLETTCSDGVKLWAAVGTSRGRPSYGMTSVPTIHPLSVSSPFSEPWSPILPFIL